MLSHVYRQVPQRRMLALTRQDLALEAVVFSFNALVRWVPRRWPTYNGFNSSIPLIKLHSFSELPLADMTFDRCLLVVFPSLDLGDPFIGGKEHIR